MPSRFSLRSGSCLLLTALAAVGCLSENSSVQAPPAPVVRPAADGVPANGTPAAGDQTTAAPTDEQPAADFTPPKLTVGDPAPVLQVGEWLKGEPVTELAADKTYVMEFWATWCGPCIAAMPHVTELQEKYKDSLTVIGVNVHEDKDAKVADFVEKKGDEMGYRVVRDDQSADEKGAMALTWLKPAEQRGIPTTFVVHQGKIAWIGHPMELDEVLPAIVEGKWDISQARTEHLAKLAVQDKLEALQQKMSEMMAAKDIAGLNAALDSVAVLNPKAAKNVELMRFMAMLQMGEADVAFAMNDKLYDGYQNEAQGLNMISWAILDHKGLEKRDYDMALKFALRANELTGGTNPAILDTLARAYFDKGEVDKAIETQTVAVENAGDSKREFAKTLRKYQAKKDPPQEEPKEEPKDELKEEKKEE